MGNLKTQEGVSMKIINGVAIKFRIERRITRHTSSEHVKDVVILCICTHTQGISNLNVKALGMCEESLK